MLSDSSKSNCLIFQLIVVISTPATHDLFLADLSGELNKLHPKSLQKRMKSRIFPYVRPYIVKT